MEDITFCFLRSAARPEFLSSPYPNYSEEGRAPEDEDKKGRFPDKIGRMQDIEGGVSYFMAAAAATAA